MSIQVQISVGEFLDKLSILEIKRTKISDPDKLVNIDREYEALVAIWNESEFSSFEISGERQALNRINEKLWEIEDRIRAKEARAEFDQEFIQMARSVYINNDERASIKRKLNIILNSGLIEEKSYKREQD